MSIFETMKGLLGEIFEFCDMIKVLRDLIIVE